MGRENVWVVVQETWRVVKQRIVVVRKGLLRFVKGKEALPRPEVEPEEALQLTRLLNCRFIRKRTALTGTSIVSTKSIKLNARR